MDNTFNSKRPISKPCKHGVPIASTWCQKCADETLITKADDGRIQYFNWQECLDVLDILLGRAKSVLEDSRDDITNLMFDLDHDLTIINSVYDRMDQLVITTKDNNMVLRNV